MAKTSKSASEKELKKLTRSVAKFVSAMRQSLPETAVTIRQRRERNIRIYRLIENLETCNQ